MPVRFQAPQLPSSAQIDKYFQMSHDSRWYANGGPCQLLLERRLADFLGLPRESVVLVSNATVGLMLAIRATMKRTEPGLVVCPSYTFAASATAVIWAGHEPLFVDVDPDNWHLCATALAAAMEEHGPHVRGILACSTFGVAPPVVTRDAWRDVARKYGVPLVVDSAAGFGSQDEDGSLSGRDGDVDVFSFHATKPFAMGEGGLVVARDPATAAAVRRLSNFGFSADRVVDGEVGLNGKISDLECAVGLAVLDQFSSLRATRRVSARIITSALVSAGFSWQQNLTSAAVQFVPVLAMSGEHRASVLGAAEDSDVECRTYYDVPLHQMPAFCNTVRHGSLATTTQLAERCISLPMANDLTPEAMDAIISACSR